MGISVVHTVQSPSRTGTVAPMNIPGELRYTSDHEWAAREADNTVRIGITDYAQDALGDVVYVQAPAVGTVVSAGQNFGEVESTKSVSEIYAPVAGTVVAVNDALVDSPALLNDDPYGEGWICSIEMSQPEVYESLLDAAAYQQLLEG
jgi:glycine cleavage system H protein